MRVQAPLKLGLGLKNLLSSSCLPYTTLKGHVLWGLLNTDSNICTIVLVSGSLPSSSSEVSINLQNDPIVKKYGSEKVSLTRCLLTKEEMKTYHFPLQGLFRFNLMLVTMEEYLSVYLKILLLKVHFYGLLSKWFIPSSTKEEILSVQCFLKCRMCTIIDFR